MPAIIWQLGLYTKIEGREEAECAICKENNEKKFRIATKNHSTTGLVYHLNARHKNTDFHAKFAELEGNRNKQRMRVEGLVNKFVGITSEVNQLHNQLMETSDDGILAGNDGIPAGNDGILAGNDGILAGNDGILAGNDGILYALPQSSVDASPPPPPPPDVARPINSRADVIQLILEQKVRLRFRWADVAIAIGLSKEWTTAACLGQMQMNEQEAEKVARIFQLPSVAKLWLQTAPSKGSTMPPSDPLLYRFNEVLSVYGPALKELIHEEFGDGIMSAIDFKVDVQREEDSERGDRVKIVWSGKFLPYCRF